MTMPKKGTRKIIVDGVGYKYVIKKYDKRYCGGCHVDRAVVTIEFPDGTYYKDTVPKFEITPAYVESLIRRERR